MILGINWDDGYFKPFTAYQFLLFVSIFNLIPQFLAIMLANRMNKR